ncbi:Aspartic proteinase Asp1 [Glycine max]|nr:Aspartic proteinase Asp1 [Glycine max]KAH1255855.1 Aspartic proteinase Asp1 [Glycine max]
MVVKSKGIPLATLLLILFLSAIFPTSFSNQVLNSKKPIPSSSASSLGSSVAFQIKGNVYPLGYYTVSLAIGNPPKVYDLDIDTGSDLTWVQCDAPCKGCTLPRNRLYKPHGDLVKCVDPLCAAIQSAPNHHCAGPNEQCDYEVEYADQGSSLGVLLRDNIPLKFTNGSLARPMLAFGCGYDQTHHGQNPPPSTAGVLGLGNGRTSILSQLHSLGLIRNVVGHCLSGRGGGFLFFGDQLIPPSGVVWTPLLQSSSAQHYKTGPADLFFDRKTTSVKGLELIFDSGSSYTYFNSQAHKALVNLIANDLRGKPLSRATGDPSLPICWKGPKPFKSLHDVTSNFKPLLLSFTKSKNSPLQLPPEAYLIVTKHGNVCLGILDGTEIGLGNTNIIGDISLQDKLVIYDNEKQRIGWASANCDRSSLMQGMLDITNDIKGKSFSRATEDPSLPICWKNPKTFKSLHDVTNYFKPIALSFTKSKNSLLQLPPEAYLIKYGNVCLGILDGTEIGLGNTNIIGDISLQDKMVIYDNEKQLCQL